MRFAVMLAAVAALFVQAAPARAGVIITGFGSGILYQQPGCIAGQISPACMGPAVTTPIVGGMRLEVPDFFLKPDGSFVLGGYIPGCGLRQCSYSATPGGSFSAGGLYGVGDPVVMFSLSGPATFVTASVDTLFLSVGYTPMPEPATWAMLLLGFGMVGAAMRHRPIRTSLNFRRCTPWLDPR